MQRTCTPLILEGQFYRVTGAPLDGASVTVDIRRDGELYTSGSIASEEGGGVYTYTLADPAPGHWRAVFSTDHEDADLTTDTDRALVVADEYFTTDLSQVASLSALNALRDDVAALTQSPDGEPITRVIPSPSGPHTCQMFEAVYNPASTAPVADVDATAQIIDLPYDRDGKLHVGDVITATLSAPDAQGHQYYLWELVWGATVMFRIKRAGILGRGIIPELQEARVKEILI